MMTQGHRKRHTAQTPHSRRYTPWLATLVALVLWWPQHLSARIPDTGDLGQNTNPCRQHYRGIRFCNIKLPQQDIVSTDIWKKSNEVHTLIVSANLLIERKSQELLHNSGGLSDAPQSPTLTPQNLTEYIRQTPWYVRLKDQIQRARADYRRELARFQSHAPNSITKPLDLDSASAPSSSRGAVLDSDSSATRAVLIKPYTSVDTLKLKVPDNPRSAQRVFELHFEDGDQERFVVMPTSLRTQVEKTVQLARTSGFPWLQLRHTVEGLSPPQWGLQLARFRASAQHIRIEKTPQALHSFYQKGHEDKVFISAHCELCPRHLLDERQKLFNQLLKHARDTHQEVELNLSLKATAAYLRTSQEVDKVTKYVPHWQLTLQQVFTHSDHTPDHIKHRASLARQIWTDDRFLHTGDTLATMIARQHQDLAQKLPTLKDSLPFPIALNLLISKPPPPSATNSPTTAEKIRTVLFKNREESQRLMKTYSDLLAQAQATSKMIAVDLMLPVEAAHLFLRVSQKDAPEIPDHLVDETLFDAEDESYFIRLLSSYLLLGQEIDAETIEFLRRPYGQRLILRLDSTNLQKIRRLLTPPPAD